MKPALATIFPCAIFWASATRCISKRTMFVLIRLTGFDKSCHLTKLLSTLGFCYGTYLWDPHYKGLDDYLQNFRPNSFPTRVAPPVFDNIP